jgi:hypothetical protein
MCTALLPPGVNPIAVTKYFSIIKYNIVDKNSSRKTEVSVRKNRQTDRKRETDMTHLLVAFLNFATAPKN